MMAVFEFSRSASFDAKRRQLTNLYRELKASTYVVASVLLYCTQIVAMQFNSFLAYSLNGRQH